MKNLVKGILAIGAVSLYLNNKINIKNKLVWNEIEVIRILTLINLVEHNHVDFKTAKDIMLESANYITDPAYKKEMILLINSLVVKNNK